MLGLFVGVFGCCLELCCDLIDLPVMLLCCLIFTLIFCYFECVIWINSVVSK